MSATKRIEIAGGGLAGLTLGLALQRAGIGATVFERDSYPRHRVCGEFIAGLSKTTIARLGLDSVLAGALHHREIAWFTKPDEPRIHSLPSPALGLSRFTLDARLAQAFLDSGGDLKTGNRVLDLSPRKGLVLAMGRRASPSPWIGLKIHLHGIPLLSPLEIHLGDQAYVGLSEIEDGGVNLCGLFRRRSLSGLGVDLIAAYLQATGLGSLLRRVRTAQPISASFCAVAAVDFNRKVPVQGALTLGDACAMVPPFTGNGMAMAFQSAEIALNPLISFARDEITWGEACTVIHRTQLKRFRLRLASAHLLHPYLLQPGKQRWLAAVDRARLLPFRPIYAALH